MSSHGHGGGHGHGHAPAPAAEAAPKPPVDKEAEARKFVEEQEKRWTEEAMMDRGFVTEFLTKHPEAKNRLNDPLIPVAEKMGWYEFYKNINKLKENLKAILDDRLVTLRQKINIAAVGKTETWLYEQIDKLVYSETVPGKRSPRETAEALLQESEEYFRLKNEINETKGELKKHAEFLFPTGGVKKVEKCASAYQDLENRKDILVKAEQAVAAAENEVRSAAQMSSGLFWRNKGKKDGEIQKAKDKLIAAVAAKKEAEEKVKQQREHLNKTYHISDSEIEKQGDEIGELQMALEVLATQEIKFSDLQYKLPSLGMGYDAGATKYIDYLIQISNQEIEIAAGDLEEEAEPEPKSSKPSHGGGGHNASGGTSAEAASANTGSNATKAAEASGAVTPTAESAGAAPTPDKSGAGQAAEQNKKYEDLLTEESINARTKDESKHLTVKIKRSNGKVEDDWKVREVEKGIAHVYKPEPAAQGQVKVWVREVHLKELRSLNKDLTKVEVKTPAPEVAAADQPAAPAPASAPEQIVNAQPAAEVKVPETAAPAPSPAEPQSEPARTRPERPARNKRNKELQRVSFKKAMLLREQVKNLLLTDKGAASGYVKPTVKFVGEDVVRRAIANRVGKKIKEYTALEGDWFKLLSHINHDIDEVVSETVADDMIGRKLAYQEFGAVFTKYMNDHLLELHEKDQGKLYMLEQLIAAMDKKKRELEKKITP